MIKQVSSVRFQEMHFSRDTLTTSLRITSQLLWFVYLLVVAVCLQGTASALAYYYSDKVDSELSVLSEVFYNYSGSSQDPLARAVDSTQEELQCCGVQGSRDWLSTPWFNRSRRATFPQSCCNSSCFHCTSSSEEHWEPYVQGCQERLEEALGFVLSLITWSLLPLLPVEILGVAIMAHMMTNNQLLHYTVLEKPSS
uniref:Uncharacterized protein n=1 Tax=Gadus morhua TaxID=8049 RepID=A0A8C5BX48_GADMO